MKIKKLNQAKVEKCLKCRKQRDTSGLKIENRKDKKKRKREKKRQESKQRVKNIDI